LLSKAFCELRKVNADLYKIRPKCARTNLVDVDIINFCCVHSHVIGFSFSIGSFCEAYLTLGI
jgi:hypothetical protein